MPPRPALSNVIPSEVEGSPDPPAPRWRPLKALLAVLLLSLLPPPTAADPPRFEPALVGAGLPITRIVLRSDVPGRDLERARQLMHVEEGQLLDHEAVRRTLLSLHGSGLVWQAEVRSRLADGGVELTLIVWSNIIVRTVDFPAVDRLGNQDLEDLVSVRPESPLVESQVMRSVFDIQDRLVELGYLEGSARARIDVNEARRSAGVAFDVETGPQATVGSIEFDGPLGSVEADAVRQAMASEVGGRYRPDRVRRDSDAAQQFLFRQDYRTARVSRPVEEYDWETHQMHLTYAVEIGPVVEFEVIGADRKTLRQAGVLPFLGPQGYDPALVTYSEARVRAWYQSRGHYEVAVEMVEERTEEVIRLTLTVEPGPVFTLRDLDFSGNESFRHEALQARMATAPRRFLEPGSGRLVDEVLAEDLRVLGSFYRLQGFHDARVGPEELTVAGDDLKLVIPVVEGERRLTGELRWEGVSALRADRLAEEIPLRAGGPFHPNLVDQSVNLVRARYRDEGFESVLASATVEWDDRRRTADVTFQVLEGPQSVVRRIVVRGNQHTSPWLLRQAVDLEPGDPVSRRMLLDIQQRLYQLGIFTQANVDLAQGNLLTGERDVVIRLEEGDRHRVSVGGGFDTEDGFRGLFGYSLGNLFGRAASLNLDTVVAEREELYRLLLRQPAMGNWRFPMTYSIFRSREQERSIDKSFEGDFIVEQQGVQVEANLRFEKLRLPVIFTYKDVDNNAPDELDEILFDRERSKVKISSLTTAMQIDHRNSVINPTEGRNTVFQVEYAFPAFNADENFLKVFAQQTHYFDFDAAGVVGASLRLGGIESYRATGPPAISPPIIGCTADPIPDFGVALSERFFAGGRSTHRAYELDTLGVLGETLFVNREETEEGCDEKGLFPTGGNGLALFNLEYRYPLGADLWATAFYDSGNVWADWRDIDLGEFKDGVGVGVGWDSPIGPLRLEIGWKLDRETGEDPYQIFLSFGSAF